MANKSLCGLTSSEIINLISPSGYELPHAVAIANSIYKKRITDFSLITKIPRILRDDLGKLYHTGLYPPVDSMVSVDRTVKYLFISETGKKFETVFIPDNKRNTVCVSTQSGCRMGCSFCATAEYGFRGNLSAGEIVNQVLSIPCTENITHVVFMGMGEPMDNLENVLKACEILTSAWGLSLSPRNVTVSTVGITPGIIRFLKDSDCNLTLSLYSPFMDQRRVVVPAEKKYPVLKIVELMKDYPLKKKRRLSLAYVMIRGWNDTDAHLESLKVLLKGSQIRINLLPYHNGGNDLNRSSSRLKIELFKHELVNSGISASIRKSRGTDISAACGLLASGIR